MRLAEKIKKLTNGQASASLKRHARSLSHGLFFSPVKPKQIIASIEAHDRFHEICDRYAIDDSGEGPPKFLNLKRWIPRNANRVHELRLDDRKRRRILDVGCGPGYFLYICRCLGHGVVGLDIDEVPMYGELTQLLEVPRVIWRIEPFVPLPDLGQFDLITSFFTCFNDHMGPGLWRIAEWDFFLDDIARHLSSKGRFWLELNRQADGQPYCPELKRFFESRGAKIDLYRVVFTSDRLARSSVLSVADDASFLVIGVVTAMLSGSTCANTSRVEDETITVSLVINEELKASIRVPYALRRIPRDTIASLLPASQSPQPGDIVLARLEKIGKNARLELTSGRPATLQEGDLLAVVYGSRYATNQFEGYTGVNGLNCDLLSMGGLCGLVRSKYDSVAEPSKLYVLGALGDADYRPLRLRDFTLPRLSIACCSKVIVVCGSSMDTGKTYSSASLIAGLRRMKKPVAAIKLTGTVSGRDTWSMLDAGACPALDFVDGGYPSTYQCKLDSLLELYSLLLAHAVSQGAEFVVIEIADGLLQVETAALLQCQSFTATIDAWIFATSDPLAAKGGIDLLRTWGIVPLAISGLIAKSPLAMAEAQAATGVRCMTGADLRRGELNRHLADDRVVSTRGSAVCA